MHGDWFCKGRENYTFLLVWTVPADWTPFHWSKGSENKNLPKKRRRSSLLSFLIGTASLFGSNLKEEQLAKQGCGLQSPSTGLHSLVDSVGVEAP